MAHATRRTAAVIAAITLVLSACGGDGAAPVVDGDLAATVEPVGDPTSDAATDDAAEVEAADDPAPAPTATASPTEDEVDPEEACTVGTDEARIEVVAPAPDTTVDETFRLAGCGNTFEATYVWEVELADGTIAGESFGTMTCGSGCVGTFDEDVTVEGAGPSTLRVFEVDAATGDRTNVVEVPITLE